MPYCINCPQSRKKYYSGKEPSPKGLGYCGGCARVGQIKLGKDGRQWVAARRSTGARYWKLSSKSPKRKKSRKPRKKTTKRKRKTSKKRKSRKQKRKSRKKARK